MIAPSPPPASSIRGVATRSEGCCGRDGRSGDPDGQLRSSRDSDLGGRLRCVRCAPRCFRIFGGQQGGQGEDHQRLHRGESERSLPKMGTPTQKDGSPFLDHAPAQPLTGAPNLDALPHMLQGESPCPQTGCGRTRGSNSPFVAAQRLDAGEARGNSTRPTASGIIFHLIHTTERGGSAAAMMEAVLLSWYS